MKKRKQKSEEYEQKYSHIPRDFIERLQWMYQAYHLNERMEREILAKRDQMLATLSFQEFFIILYEEPEGTPRPRFRLINRRNISSIQSPFIHVYSITGSDDQRFM